jgi:hypothetical protein
MRKFLWLALWVGFFAGPVTAQAIPSREKEGKRFLIAEHISQGNSTMHSDETLQGKAPSNARTTPLTGKEKLRYMTRSTYEPESIMFSLAGAGIKQARDTDPEWGQGTEGYGKRLASSLGHKAVNRGIRLGLGSLFHEDPRYFFSESRGIWRRTLFAASRTFVSNKDGGGIRPGYTKFVTQFAGAYISRQWHPEREHTLSEYLKSGAISVGLDTAKNVFNEFWPDVKKILRR